MPFLPQSAAFAPSCTPKQQVCKPTRQPCQEPAHSLFFVTFHAHLTSAESVSYLSQVNSK